MILLDDRSHPSSPKRRMTCPDCPTTPVDHDQRWTEAVRGSAILGAVTGQ